jgi:hypothetical protein
MRNVHDFVRSLSLADDQERALGVSLLGVGSSHGEVSRLLRRVREDAERSEHLHARNSRVNASFLCSASADLAAALAALDVRLAAARSLAQLLEVGDSVDDFLARVEEGA